MSAATQTSSADLDALIAQLGFTRDVVTANTAGLTQDDTTLQPSPGGNCLNWVLGHMVAARNDLLELLGKKPLWSSSEREPYRRGGPALTEPGKALALERLLTDLGKTQELLSEALRGIPAERLSEKAPLRLGGDEAETVGSLIAGFVFHDAYHAGQTGLLRRLVGKAGAIG
jgi:uncharacterized damage-inducible protein DinB